MTMAQIKKSRRSIISGAFGFMSAAAFAKSVLAAVPTPSATEGPYYPTPSMRPADIDNDLVKVAGAVRKAGGEIITLKGRILDKRGTPLVGLRIEIWQCDVNGKYLHAGDRQDIEFDPDFQGFGHDITDKGGYYSFRTIKPVLYPGRAPHIHVKLFDDVSEILTTQFYLANHPANREDWIFNRLSENEALSVSMTFSLTDQGQETTINILV